MADFVNVDVTFSQRLDRFDFVVAQFSALVQVLRPIRINSDIFSAIDIMPRNLQKLKQQEIDQD